MEKQKQAEAHAVRQQVDTIAHYIDDGGRVSIDPHTGQLYDPDIEAAHRAAERKWIQRYGTPQRAPAQH